MIARQTTLIFAQNMIGAVLGSIALLLVARNMGAEPLGVIGFALGFMGLFSIVVDLGFDQTHVKRISEGQDPAKCIGLYMIIKLTLVCAMSILVISSIFIWKFVLGRGFQTATHEMVLYVMLGYSIFNSLSRIAQQTFAGHSLFVKQQIPILIGTVVQTTSTIFVALFIKDTLALAFTYLASSISIFVINIILFRGIHISWPNRTIFRSYYKYAIPVLIPISMTLIQDNIDKVMIQLFWNSTEVGYFFGFQRITAVLLVIPFAIFSVLFPSMSRHHQKNEISAIRLLTYKAERYASMVLAPIVFFIVFFGRPLIHLILSDDFLPGAPILTLLTVNVYLVTMRNVHGSQIFALSKHGVLAKLSPLLLILTVGLNVLFIPTSLFGVKLLGMSAFGAAAATLIVTVVSLVTIRVIVYRLTKTASSWRVLIHLLCAFDMAMALYMLNLLIDLSRWYELLLFFGVGLVIYLGLLYLCREFTKKDFNFFLDIINPKKMATYIGDEMKDTDSPKPRSTPSEERPEPEKSEDFDE